MSRSHASASRAPGGGGHLDKVQQFVVYLYEHIREKNIPETRSMYTRSFFRLSEMYFKDSPWPPVEQIADFVDSDQVFCLLYQELYYRHLYATLWPSLVDRSQSWDTYCQLFDIILHGKVTMQLPNEWLWDMIDEFLYQFQAYHQFKGKPSQHTPEEKATIRHLETSNERIWDILDVLNYLQAIVNKSGIAQYFQEGGEMELLQKQGYHFSSNVLIVLGYVCMIGLSRVHALIGDYGGSLNVLTQLKVYEPKSLFASKIPGSFITLYYYVAFSYLMMRRYIDAAKCLNVVLLYIPGAKDYVADRTKLSQLERKEEQMFQLLAIIVALCPRVQKQYIDDRVAERLMENFADKVQAMRRGNIHVYDELFSAGCPRFINTNPPDFTRDFDTNQASYQNQLKLFVEDVKQNISLPDLLQYMHLYSSISIQKLAALLDTDENAIRTQLMCMKNKQYAKVHNGQDTDLLSGTFSHAGSIDFYLDMDMETGMEYVMIQDNIVKKSHVQTMIRHIHKFKEITRDMKQMQSTSKEPGAAA